MKASTPTSKNHTSFGLDLSWLNNWLLREWTWRSHQYPHASICLDKK